MAEKTLTLEQVKRAGRPAEWVDTVRNTVTNYHPECDNDDCGGCFVMECCSCGSVVDSMTNSDLELEEMQDGWHHLPGCDCEFCKA